MYKYLGAETGKSGQGKWNVLMARMYRNTESNLSLLLYRGGGSAGLYPAAFIRLWNMVCRPLLEYGCELWEGEISAEWERKLESVQSHFLRSVGGLKGTPAAVGLRTEFKVMKLKARRRILKLGFWRTLCTCESSRLFSLVFRRRHEKVLAGGAALSSLRSFETLLQECGMSYRWAGRKTLDEQSWRSAVRLAVRDMTGVEEMAELGQRSTLSLFSELKLEQDTIPQYLNDRSNVEGVRLMTKARLGYMWLMKAVSKTVRHGAVSGVCRLCLYNVMEDVEHFLLGCPVLEVCRRQLEYRMEQVLPSLGDAGAQLLERFNDARVGRLRVLLGDLEVECVEKEDPVDDRLVKAQAGKARWFVDKAVKNFLVACWRLRVSLLGSMTVVAGCLVVERSSRTTESVLEAQELFQEIDLERIWVGTRPFWSEWIPVSPKGELMVWPVRKGPSAFYAVRQGRTVGLFYSWAHCRRSVAGFVGSVFCGRLTLAEANDWLHRV
jgi:hypothetical protein